MAAARGMDGGYMRVTAVAVALVRSLPVTDAASHIPSYDVHVP